MFIKPRHSLKQRPWLYIAKLDCFCYNMLCNGPLARYVKIRVAHAPGMPGTFSPAANFRGNYYIAIPACITARAWRTCRDACRDPLPAVTGKTFPAFPAHAQPQFCVSGKRPMHCSSYRGCCLISFSLENPHLSSPRFIINIINHSPLIYGSIRNAKLRDMGKLFYPLSQQQEHLTLKLFNLKK